MLTLASTVVPLCHLLFAEAVKPPSFRTQFLGCFKCAKQETVFPYFTHLSIQNTKCLVQKYAILDTLCGTASWTIFSMSLSDYYLPFLRVPQANWPPWTSQYRSSHVLKAATPRGWTKTKQTNRWVGMGPPTVNHLWLGMEAALLILFSHSAMKFLYSVKH